MANSTEGKKVLFICLGNICRSPIAEAVFNHMVKERGLAGWEVDSGAIGSWHVGLGPDRRAVTTMKKHDIHMSHKARQLKKADFSHYDYIFGMDHDNITDIKDMGPKTYSTCVELFGSYDPQKELLIRDPYYLGKAVVYTDSLSSLHLLLSRHPRSSTSLVHTIQRALHLTNEGWEIAFQWVPSHAGIPGNEVADSAARMALTDVNTTPFPLPLSAAKRLISRVCRSTWNNTLGDALCITSMGQYRSDSSPQPWIRKKSRVLDVTHPPPPGAHDTHSSPASPSVP
ncbi:Low molecular weight phosphotyrosine protein phosphatase [Chionoecetes opilio]|uniref:Low molecular weight phosphotyrosine protein phosphatase n=1 Tax=Chionoecetes opilio TaxID=41210 RepID=A0A8J4YM18_CHIOP|nr:Low molecular weight phosphotyrosine protein phosphatase [Chionoecetes opilio]